ncbi:MAG: HepT-like ribonuclease domain-containing protein [Brumimicrobium sp.]
MQHNVKMYLSDISNSIESIYEYLGEERDFNKYESNKLLRRAVERELEIIGEAVNRLLKLDSSIVISDARRIVSLRNWVIHAYDNVDNVIIWGIINKDLPMLEKQVKKLLKE